MGMALGTDATPTTYVLASPCAPNRVHVINSRSPDPDCGSDDSPRFVKQLRKDGKGFELVETNQIPRLFAGGKKRNKKRARAAKKARKKQRRKRR